ncbi:MEIKN protein, partial [Turnix velox]|nr:MEIKN protein [Turnix velox]
MTLPTGVSTFLLECLDTDSTEDYNTDGSDSLSSFSSPETFRDESSGEGSSYSKVPGKYKNSTLLDSSKAVAADKVLQISNLSAILEPGLDDFQDKCSKRKRPANCSYSSSALNVSATVSGKKICKVTAARERTPDLKAGVCCSSPLGLESKLAHQTAEPKRPKRKKRETKSNASGEGSSSSQPHALGSVRAKSKRLEEALPSNRRDPVVPLPGKELCSIVGTSPCQRPRGLHQIPVNTKAFRRPLGVP